RAPGETLPPDDGAGVANGAFQSAPGPSARGNGPSAADLAEHQKVSIRPWPERQGKRPRAGPGHRPAGVSIRPWPERQGTRVPTEVASSGGKGFNPPLAGAPGETGFTDTAGTPTCRFQSAPGPSARGNFTIDPTWQVVEFAFQSAPGPSARG